MIGHTTYIPMNNVRLSSDKLVRFSVVRLFVISILTSSSSIIHNNYTHHIQIMSVHLLVWLVSCYPIIYEQIHSTLLYSMPLSSNDLRL
jgi:hypothetical protein